MVTILGQMTRRIAERRAHSAALREHDNATSDPRVAGEHRAAIDRALERGEPGCLFCH
jgi:hypothetical protein